MLEKLVIISIPLTPRYILSLSNIGLPNFGEVSLATRILPQQLASLLDGFFTTELDKL